jgi:hypothetical protein
MRSDDDAGDRRPKRVVYEHEIAALTAIHDYRDAKLNGGVPDRIVRELAQRALDFREVLHKYRNEDALDPAWDERPIHWIDDYQNETRLVEKPSSRRNSNTKTVEQPAILSVDPEALVDVIRELEDIADQLGFSAPVRSPTDHNQVDHDELAELLQLRGQDEALERVPGGES